MKACHDSRITIVVLTYNRAPEVLRTLSHLVAVEESPPIIVVDNASTDGTVTMIAELYPYVQVLRMNANVGAAARNVGIRRATTPYVALCDDDTWWDSGSLRHAADVLDRHPHIAVVAARVVIGPNEHEDAVSGVMAKSPLPRSVTCPGPPILGFLAGASMVRRDAFLAVGGFESRFFLGAEEALVAYDLADSGWTMIYLSSATVHHYPSRRRQSLQRRRLLLRNELWLAWLRRPVPSAFRATWRTLRKTVFDAQTLSVLWEALQGSQWVWTRRRVVSPEVERALRLLETDGQTVHLERFVLRPSPGTHGKESAGAEREDPCES